MSAGFLAAYLFSMDIDTFDDPKIRAEALQMFFHDYPQYASSGFTFEEFEKLNCNLATKYLIQAEKAEDAEIWERMLEECVELRIQKMDYKNWKRREMGMRDGWREKFWFWLKH